jgi:hypothetical protein
MKKNILTIALTIFIAVNTFAQIGDVANNVLSGGAKFLGNGLTKKLQRDPITTSFSDCDTKNTLPVTFGADKDKAWLCDQLFEQFKGYQLKPGFYKAYLKSFCLKAGTYGPSKGSGYIYAPLKGPKKDLVFKLLTNWKNHPEIAQTNLQLLLWAIISKTKFKNLSPELKIVATQLLSTNDMDELSKVGLEFVGDELVKKASYNLPEPAQKILAVENEMRRKLCAATVSYSEMENLAMLAGIAPTSSTIEDGLWSLLPNGCYIKFVPYGYSKSYIEIYVPDTILNGIIFFDITGIVAMPAATGCQRLAQSNILICEKK